MAPACAHRICSMMPVGYFLIGPCWKLFGRQAAVSGGRMTPETAWKRRNQHDLGIPIPLVPRWKEVVLMADLTPGILPWAW